MLKFPRALKFQFFPSPNKSVKFLCLNSRLVIIYWILSGAKAGRASAHYIWKQGRKRRLWRNAVTFPNISRKVPVRGGVSSKFLCSRWVRTQGDNARKQESLAFLRPQELCTPRYLLYSTGGLWNGNCTLRWTPLSWGSMHILEIWHLPSLFGTLPASILVFMENELYCQG